MGQVVHIEEPELVENGQRRSFVLFFEKKAEKQGTFKAKDFEVQGVHTYALDATGNLYFELGEGVFFEDLSVLLIFLDEQGREIHSVRVENNDEYWLSRIQKLFSLDLKEQAVESLYA